MGLEALGNAVAFPCPSALWLSGAGLLLWGAKEGVLVAPRSQGANFLYLSLTKVLGNYNCSILEPPDSLESLEHILPFPKAMSPQSVPRGIHGIRAAVGQQDGQEELSPIFCAVLLFSTFQAAEKGNVGI